MISIKKIQINNFRLLANVEMLLENETTLVVGRNNSGKTSLSEVIRRFLDDTNPRFQIEDFSSACYGRFCEALDAKNAGKSDDDICNLIPSIELHLYFQYDITKPLGPLSDFIIDINMDCNEAVILACYELADGKISEFFADQSTEELKEDTRQAFFGVLRERIPTMYATKVCKLSIQTTQTTENKCHLAHYIICSEQDL